MSFSWAVVGAALIWAAYAFNEWHEIAYPKECPHEYGSRPYQACFEPLLGKDDVVDVHFYAGMGNVPPKEPIWSAWGLPASEEWEKTLTVPLPPEVRQQGAEMRSWIVISKANHTVFEDKVVYVDGRVVTQQVPREVPDPALRLVRTAQLTTRAARGSSASSARKLLNSNGDDDGDMQHVMDKTQDDPEEVVNHWKYAVHPLTFRVVDFGHRTLYRSFLPALKLQLHTRRVLRTDTGADDADVADVSGRVSAQNVYEPQMYADDLSLMRRHRLQVSTNTSWPAPRLRFKYVPTSPTLFAYKITMRTCLELLGQLGLGETETDEIRYWLSDARLKQYLLTQAITFAHIVLEYMAFRDDWRFFVGRKSFAGVSTTSVFFSAVRNLVIFLYLLDADTSAIVLFSVGKDILWTFYKVYRIAQPRLHMPPGAWLPRVAYLENHGLNAEEVRIAEYDRYATRHVSLAVYPMVVGLAAYSLLHTTYTSWWSWFIGSLADSVYFFGFIAMCPQLYINYKLRSVAHLPVAAFGYKIFNTFIDDVFAFLVHMPLKHRLMTLRDDVVFLGFIYQWWAYRRDLARVNEFGFRFQDDGTVSEVVVEVVDGEGGGVAADPKVQLENVPEAAVEAKPESESDLIVESEPSSSRILRRRRTQAQ